MELRVELCGWEGCKQQLLGHTHAIIHRQLHFVSKVCWILISRDLSSPPHPDRLWSQLRFLFKEYQGSLHGSKADREWRWPRAMLWWQNFSTCSIQHLYFKYFPFYTTHRPWFSFNANASSVSCYRSFIHKTTARNGPVHAGISVPELLFVLEYHTGTYQYGAG
jgi:hypothetical protein